MSNYRPCYKCGNEGADPVSFTWWGGLLGPKLFTHVKCRKCGTCFNGKTGQSNSTKIGIYLAVTFGLLVPFFFCIGIGAIAGG